MSISDITRNFYQNPLLYSKTKCQTNDLGYKSLKSSMNYNLIFTQKLLQLKRQKQSCQKIKEKYFSISRSNSLKLFSQEAFSQCDKSKQSQYTCGSDIERQQSTSNFSETKYQDIYLTKQNNYDLETPLIITQSIIPHYQSKQIAIPRENRKRSVESLKFPKIEYFQENLVQKKNYRLSNKQSSISKIVNAKRQSLEHNIYNCIEYTKQMMPKQQTSDSSMKKVYLFKGGREKQLKQWHNYYIKCSKTAQISSWDNTQQEAYSKQVTEEKEQNILDLQNFEEYVQNLKQK